MKHNLIIIRILTAWFIFLATINSCYASKADGDLAAFEESSGIQLWPRLDGCHYAEAFKNKITGIIINVHSATRAAARWDGRCHVPIMHELSNWPVALSPGRYVVAVRSMNDGQIYPAYNRSIKIIAVMGKHPDKAEFLSAAIKKICATPINGHEIDRDCEIEKDEKH